MIFQKLSIYFSGFWASFHWGHHLSQVPFYADSKLDFFRSNQALGIYVTLAKLTRFVCKLEYSSFGIFIEHLLHVWPCPNL